MAPMCFSRLDTSTYMQYDLLAQTRDLTWPWPEVKFWNWPFLRSICTMCIFRHISTRGTWCCQNHVTSFLSSKVMCEKKNIFTIKRDSHLSWPLYRSSPNILTGWQIGHPVLQKGHPVMWIWPSSGIVPKTCRNNFWMIVYWRHAFQYVATT